MIECWASKLQGQGSIPLEFSLVRGLGDFKIKKVAQTNAARAQFSEGVKGLSSAQLKGSARLGILIFWFSAA